MSETSSCCKSKMACGKVFTGLETPVYPASSNEGTTHCQTPCNDPSSLVGCKEASKGTSSTTACEIIYKDTSSMTPCKIPCNNTDRSSMCGASTITPSGCNETNPRCVVVLKGCIADDGAADDEVAGNDATGDEPTDDEADGEAADENETACGGKGGCWGC